MTTWWGARGTPPCGVESGGGVPRTAAGSAPSPPRRPRLNGWSASPGTPPGHLQPSAYQPIAGYRGSHDRPPRRIAGRRPPRAARITGSVTASGTADIPQLASRRAHPQPNHRVQQRRAGAGQAFGVEQPFVAAERRPMALAVLRRWMATAPSSPVALPYADPLCSRGESLTSALGRPHPVAVGDPGGRQFECGDGDQLHAPNVALPLANLRTACDGSHLTRLKPFYPPRVGSRAPSPARSRL
jgi:hypothetical protein